MTASPWKKGDRVRVHPQSPELEGLQNAPGTVVHVFDGFLMGGIDVLLDGSGERIALSGNHCTRLEQISDALGVGAGSGCAR
jgi:hypothetical protein